MGRNISLVLSPGPTVAGQPVAIKRGAVVLGRVSYRPPLVTSWLAPPQPMRFADTSDPASRYWIEVHGQDFGGADLGASAFVGGVACRQTVWVNDSVVRCEAPSLVG